MKVYRLEYKEELHVLVAAQPGAFGDTNSYVYTPKVMDQVEWFKSEREAVVRRMELYKLGKLVGKKREAKIWGVEVPTRHIELVAWLNKQQRDQWK